MLKRVAVVAALLGGCMADESTEPPLERTQGQALTLAENVYTNGTNYGEDPFYTGTASTAAAVMPTATDAPLAVVRSNQLKLWLSKYTPVAGFADLHSHMFAEYAFGGGWFHGRASGKEVTAMGSCDHGATIIKGFAFKGDKHFKKDAIALGVAHAKCLLPWNSSGSTLEQRFNSLLGCVGNAADGFALHFLTETHAALKLPLHLLAGDMFNDDGNHSSNLGGFENGYSGWPTNMSGAHQQVWQGFLRQAHEQIPFAHYLKTHVYQTTSGVINSDATTHLPALQTAFVSAWTSTISGNTTSWPKQAGYTGTTMTTFINDYHLALALLDFRGTNYATYMKEARDAGKAGLNLVVVSAVDFKPLCELAPNLAGNYNLSFRNHDIHIVSSLGHADGGWQGTANKCGETTIFQELTAASSFATTNAGWVDLVNTPAEARAAIAAGKLAMVLSVEHSDLFDAVTDSTQIAAKVQDLKTRQVSTFQLVHEFDNLLAGNAANNPVFMAFGLLRKLYKDAGGNMDSEFFAANGPIDLVYSLTGKLATLPNCSKFSSIASLLNYLHITVYTHGLKIRAEIDFDETTLLADAQACMASALGWAMKNTQQCHLPGSATEVPCVGIGASNTTATTSGWMVNSAPQQAENEKGLLPFGRAAVDEMMNQGMPIDVAHASTQTIRDLDRYLTQTNHCAYPLYVSHAHIRGVETPIVRDKAGTQIIDNSTTSQIEGWGKDENYLSDEALKILAARGGMVGIRTSHTETSTTISSTYPSGAGQGTTWSYAQIAQYVWSKGVNSTFATDMNGFITMTKGRCNQSGDLGCGTKKLNTDFDWKGLAHEGYLADFFRDLLELDVEWFGGAVRTATLNQLYGTEAYLRMWERAQLLKNAPTWRANGWTCLEIEDRMLTSAGVTALNAARPATPAAAPTASTAYTAVSPRLTGYDNVGAKIWYPKIGTNAATALTLPLLASLDFVVPRDLDSSTIAGSNYVTNMITLLDGTFTATYSDISQRATITVPTSCTNSTYGGTCSAVTSAKTEYNTGQIDQNMYWTTWANLAWQGHFGAYGRMDDNVATRSGDSKPVTWLSTVGVTVSGNDLIKSTATTQWGDSGAWSNQTLDANGGELAWAVGENTTMRELGLSASNTDNNYTSIDYGFLAGNTKALTVRENGTTRVTTTYLPGDVLKIQVINGQVKFLKNDILLYTSLVAPTYPLHVDAALYSAATATSNAATITDIALYSYADTAATASSWMGCCAAQCASELAACDADAACNLCIANDPAATGCDANGLYQAIGTCLDSCRETPESAGGCGTGVVMCASNFTPPTADTPSGSDTMSTSGCTSYGGTCNFDYVCDASETVAGCPYDCANCMGGTFYVSTTGQSGYLNSTQGISLGANTSVDIQVTQGCDYAFQYDFESGNCGTPNWSTTGKLLSLHLLAGQTCKYTVHSIGQWHHQVFFTTSGGY